MQCALAGSQRGRPTGKVKGSVARGCRSFNGRRGEDDLGSPVEGFDPPCEVHGASSVGGSERFVEAGARRDADDERVFLVSSSNRVRSSRATGSQSPHGGAHHNRGLAGSGVQGVNGSARRGALAVSASDAWAVARASR